MANRVLLGQGTTQRGGTSKYGLWVSKPGQNVLTCSDDNLIFDMDKGGSADIKGMFQLQTVTGTASASATTTFTINSFTTSGVNVTNLETTVLNLSFSVMPFFSSNARF